MNFSSSKIVVIFCLLAIMPFLLHSQSKKAVRAEIETTEEAKPFTIVNLGKSGILILSKLNEFVDRKTQNWSFTYYNNILQKKWVKKLALTEDFSYQGYEFEKDTACLIFYKADKRSNDKNLKIISLELSKGNHTSMDTLLTDKSQLTNLEHFQHHLFFTLENKSNIMLVNIDYYQRSFKEILIDKNDNTNVECMTIDSLNKVMYLLIKKEVSKHANSFFLRKYDLSGTELSSIEIKNSDESRKLLTGMITVLKDGSIAISGSYNLSDEKTSNYAETSVLLEAAGTYFVKMTKDSIHPIHFINFLSYENINKYLNKREVSKIKKIQENQTQKEFSLNYLLIEHKLIQMDHQLILVAEALYPEYRVISDMTYDYYGRMTPTSRTIFDGYRYTNAFVLCLDEDGHTKWNQLFDIWNILSMEIKEKVSVMPLKDDVLISYNDDGEIVYKIMNDTTTSFDIGNLKVEMSYANDKAMFSPSSNIDYWYANYYLAFGIQTIKNNSLANRSKRTVFYMNKVSFE
ncbi:MAG: hypothetical protein ACOYOV_07795 [Bacteroidales bacterium]